MARALIPLALVVIAGACGFALWRLVALRRRRGARIRQETSLPYEVWYALRQTDPAAAERFLTALWDQLQAERSRVAGQAAAGGPAAGVQSLLEAQVAEMAGAADALRRAHAGEPALPPALTILDEQVRRLCGDVAALRPGGNP
ncbi:MAG: hypothetical protein ABSD56_04925 [Bryobacteraceae bacterium]|jgi:hypothetical protein